MRERKAAILARLAADIRVLERSQGSGYALYEQWIADGLNNAHLASVATYYDCVPGSSSCWRESGGDLGASMRRRARWRASRPRLGTRACAARRRRPARVRAAGSAVRVAAPHFQHQHRGALGALAQLRRLATLPRFAPTMTSSAAVPASAAALPGSMLRTSAPPASGASASAAPSKLLWMTLGPPLSSVAGVGDHRGDLQRLAVAQQPDVHRVPDAQQADGVAHARGGP